MADFTPEAQQLLNLAHQYPDDENIVSIESLVEAVSINDSCLYKYFEVVKDNEIGTPVKKNIENVLVSPSFNRVLNIAKSEAYFLKKEHITPELLFVALLRSDDMRVEILISAKGLEVRFKELLKAVYC